MADCKAAATLMEESLRLSCDSTAEEVDATLYRHIIGSLQYLIHTRPDLTYAVGYVSWILERPTEEHLQCNIPATPGLAIVTSDSYLGS
jgi:hypothetical protein